jgi:uncharacterized membrane protein YccC
MFVLRSGPRRWPGGLRSAVCMGAPVLVGWLVGDLTSGLTATLGGFTALYGSGRPYRNRAALLAVIAVSLSAAVGLDTNHENPTRVALLVLAGGAFAWLVHMTASTPTALDPSAAETARRLARHAAAPIVSATVTPRDELPLGHPGMWALLRHNLQPHSRPLLVVSRVGVAALIAGGLGSLLGLQHAYWAISTAVLMLYQGLDRRRTTQRGLERLAGTWLGLVLAAAVIVTHPHALGLVAAIMALNFLIELTVTRNYPLAVMFITAVALLIATGGQRHTDLVSLLLARGLDTALGCAVALAVFLLMVPARVATWLPTAIADTLNGINATTAYLSPAAVTTAAARTARRDLQRRVLALTQTFDTAVNGSTAQRRGAEQSWPAMAATQRLAYRTLAECWPWNSCTTTTTLTCGHHRNPPLCTGL